MIPNNVMNRISKLNRNVRDLQNARTPDDVAQYLLNTGRVTQEQVNQSRKMWDIPQVQEQVMQRFR